MYWVSAVLNWVFVKNHIGVTQRFPYIFCTKSTIQIGYFINFSLFYTPGLKNNWVFQNVTLVDTLKRSVSLNGVHINLVLQYMISTYDWSAGFLCFLLLMMYTVL